MIILDYDPFSMSSNIFISKDGKTTETLVESSVDKITDFLIKEAYKNNTYTIKINSSPDFIEEFKNQIEEKELNNYSENKIKVESI